MPCDETLCQSRNIRGCGGAIGERLLHMGKKDYKPFVKKNSEKNLINPLVVFLAFLLGAVTAYAMFWRSRASGNKKGGWASGKAADHGSVQGDKDPAELLIKNPQQIMPYRPRKRVITKKMFGRAVAMTAAAALLVTGFYMAPNDSVPVPTVQARESFGGIKQVVEEHDEDHPFVILDIVPGKAQAEVNDKKYDFSLGTIGYLAPGQSPVQKDLSRIFRGDESEQSTDFYKYTDRKTLTDAVIGDGYGEIVYREAYGGTGEDLKASLWSQIFDSAEVEHDENGILTDAVSYPTGRLYAHVQRRTDVSADAGSLSVLTGFDYNLTGQPGGSSIFGASDMTVLPMEGIYTFAEGQGDYHVIFGEPVLAANGYRAEVVKSVSGEVDDVISALAEYVDATGLYYVEDGRYKYVCTLGEFKGIPRPEPKPEEPDEPNNPETPEKPDQPAGPEQPTEPGNPEQPSEPGNPEQPSEPENPEQPSEPENPEQPTEPGNPEQPADPEQPTEPGNPEQPADPEQPSDSGNPEQPANPTIPENTPEMEQSRSLSAGFQTQPVLKNTGAEDGWYLCVGMEPVAEPSPNPVPDPAPEPENPTDPIGPENPTDPVGPENPTDPVGPENPTDPVGPENPTDPIEPTPVPGQPEVPDGTYCVLKFTYVEAEEEQLLYQIKEVSAVSAEEGIARPYDSYILEKDLFQNDLDAAETEGDIFDEEPALAGQFEYVGGGKGMYKITRDRTAESTSAYYIEVQNAPVYIRCTGGNDFLRRYVFNSLNKQDNASDEFAIRVNTKLAGEVTQEDVRNADLVYLEDGTGLYLNPEAEKSYITLKDAENVSEDGLTDVSEMVITCLLEEAVQSLKPVIVDYGIIEDSENGVSANYKGSAYQKLAKTFLKKDLLAFYDEMAKEGNLADNILMNVDKELEDHPDKKDNDFHYVNRNIYVVNGTPLVGDDFPDTLDKNEAKSGFGEVLAAIKAENILLPEDERISEKVSKAMAVQYIINYSLGLVGEYKDLSILELQPTANMKSDLHPHANDKGNVVLFWQREDQEGEGQQILRSSKKIEIKTTLSSVVAFNTSYQDINEDYNMIFIGLDGQRFYHEPDKDGKMMTVFNDEDLNGKVYHTGDRVANRDTRYDASDITVLKKEALLDYLRAGYPIVVENDCFKGRSAQKADESDINTKYIASDTQMYDFLKEAISMGRSDEDDEDHGVGIYTIEDVHSSAMFAMQLNAQRPKIELRAEGDSGGNDSDGEQRSSDMIAAEAVPERPGILRGTIEYRITSDRAGDDKTYWGSLDKHLYLDLNYDGVFAPEEEFAGYQFEESDGIGRISVDFNEINFGMVPWKLEVRDTDNEYRRAAAQGCFTISGSDRAKIRVLQILDDTDNRDKNIQKQYEDINNSTLAHYLSGAEALLKMDWDIEAVTPGELADRISKNANYLSLWDVVALGFGDSGNPGDVVMNAVNAFIDEGGSIVVSSAGASADKGRAGLSAEVLGQKNEQTYGRLSMGSGSKFRYEGIKTEVFDETTDLLLDRINDGTVARWPYEIDLRVQLSNITKLSVPDYLLDIGTEKEAGKAYTTAWFTLFDQETSDGYGSGGYSVSPRDGRNNYYVYSKGNVVYVGQSMYPYYYDKDKDAPTEGDGIQECRIFVNALMAAYNAGVHRADVSIVAGFNGVTKVESVTIPYDVAFKEGGDAKGGILGETIDVYFCFTDNNIACDKTTELSLFYKNAGAAPEAELLLPGGGINSAAYTAFTSPVWAVENNRLVEVTGGIVPGKVYRVKAPLAALQNGDDETSRICVLLTNRYTRAGQSVEALSMDSVSLNRAQMFLLE